MNILPLQAVTLSRAFGSTMAVNRLSLDCRPGTITVLLGRNGAGKTTLMRLWAGLIAPTSGEIRVLGQDPRTRNGKARSSIAWMGEGHTPPPEATVQQCLELQAQADPGFDRHGAERMLTDRNIATNDSVHSLSKGKLQTLLAACALGRPAPILLLDEPAEGMDIKARRDFYRTVRNHVDDHGSTALISTHILHDIEPVADEIAIIHGGCLLLHESLEDMRDQIRILPPSDLPAIPLPPDSETVGTGPDGARIIRARSAWPDPVIPPLRPFNLEELFLALTTIPGEDS